MKNEISINGTVTTLYELGSGGSVMVSCDVMDSHSFREIKGLPAAGMNLKPGEKVGVSITRQQVVPEALPAVASADLGGFLKRLVALVKEAQSIDWKSEPDTTRLNAVAVCDIIADEISK